MRKMKIQNLVPENIKQLRFEEVKYEIYLSYIQYIVTNYYNLEKSVKIGTLLQCLFWVIFIVIDKLWLIINIIIIILFILNYIRQYIFLSDYYNVLFVTIKNGENLS